MDMEIEWYGGWGRRDMNDGLIVIGWDRKKSCGGLSVKGWQARKEKLWGKYGAANKSCRIGNGWRKEERTGGRKFCSKRNNDRRIVNFLRKWIELQGKGEKRE